MYISFALLFWACSAFSTSNITLHVWIRDMYGSASQLKDCGHWITSVLALNSIFSYHLSSDPLPLIRRKKTVVLDIWVDLLITSSFIQMGGNEAISQEFQADFCCISLRTAIALHCLTTHQNTTKYCYIIWLHDFAIILKRIDVFNV